MRVRATKNVKMLLIAADDNDEKQYNHFVIMGSLETKWWCSLKSTLLSRAEKCAEPVWRNHLRMAVHMYGNAAFWVIYSHGPYSCHQVVTDVR